MNRFDDALTDLPLDRTFWRDRRVFVTGATGLVGTWTVKLLIELGADVVCLIRDWVPHSDFVRSGLADHCSMVHGDLCDMALLERTLAEYDVKTVLHLAAQSQVGVAVRSPIGTLETNIAGTYRLLEACRRNPLVQQIVIASSDKAYGDQPKLPYDESFPFHGRAPYDVSKACAALLGFSFFSTFKLPVCITLCGNFYGPGDLNWNRLVPGTIRDALRGKAPVLRSNGQYIRDYFYVKDGAIAYCTLAQKMAELPEIHGESFNFSNERQLTVLELVNTILRLTGRGDLVPIIHDQAKTEILHQSLSARKAHEMLSWHPRWELEAALAQTIPWYEALLADQA